MSLDPASHHTSTHARYRLWVEGRPKALHLYVYSFLRIISDHKSPTLKELQQAEIDLTIRLLRHNVSIVTRRRCSH